MDAMKQTKPCLCALKASLSEFQVVLAFCETFGSKQNKETHSPRISGNITIWLVK